MADRTGCSGLLLCDVCSVRAGAFSCKNGASCRVPRHLRVVEAVPDAKGIAASVAALPQAAHRRPHRRRKAALAERQAAVAPAVAGGHAQLSAKHRIQRPNLSQREQVSAAAYE